MPNATAPVSGELPIPGELRKTLRWVTDALRDFYASRLRHLILFGSQARGDARSESDVDLLVVLEGPISFYDEAKRTSRVATEAAAYRDTALSFVHMSAEEFSEHWRPLVRSVRKEGVDLRKLFPERSSTRHSSEEPTLEPEADRSR